MARGQGCMCRVPITECVIPVFATSREQFEWLAENRVTDLGPDHLGRTSIPVADAMRLYQESAVRASRDETARAEAAEREAARLTKLNTRRQETFERELYAAARRGVIGGRAQVAARKALELVEADLDETTKNNLGPVRYNMTKLGAAEMAGMQRMQDEENDRPDAEVGVA